MVKRLDKDEFPPAGYNRDSFLNEGMIWTSQDGKTYYSKRDSRGFMARRYGLAKGPVPLPDFIRGQADGTMVLIDGQVFEFIKNVP